MYTFVNEVKILEPWLKPDCSITCTWFFRATVADINRQDGKKWNYPGQQLRSDFPPLAERDALYAAAGSEQYTKFYKLPTDIRDFDKFTRKFNETHWMHVLIYFNNKMLILRNYCESRSRGRAGEFDWLGLIFIFAG